MCGEGEVGGVLLHLHRCVRVPAAGGRADRRASGEGMARLRAADEPGADMHVIFDVYTEQDENFYRAILGEDEKPASDTEE